MYLPKPNTWEQQITTKVFHTSYALYPRLSHEDELQGESNSISNQKRILETYAKQNGFSNLRWYTDDGYSGANFQRPGFQSMLADIEAGKVPVFFVCLYPHKMKNTA